MTQQYPDNTTMTNEEFDTLRARLEESNYKIDKLLKESHTSMAYMLALVAGMVFGGFILVITTFL